LASQLIDHAVPLIRAIVIHPDGRSESSRQADERLQEAVGLARALDLDVRAEEIVRIRKPTPATLFGSGKVDELAALVRAAVAEAVVVDELGRQESRGAHYRRDYPARDDANWLKHTVVHRDPEGNVHLDYLPVRITRWLPAARVY